MPGPHPEPLPPTRYRIVCYELHDDEPEVILDEVAHAFIAVTGTTDENNTMSGKGTNAGHSRSCAASPACSPTTNGSSSSHSPRSPGAPGPGNSTPSS
jgi:hypothetical protein